MVTVHTARYMGGRKYIEGDCLSIDTKPTDNIMNGSKLIEMDTGSTYMYDEANMIWWELQAGSSSVVITGDINFVDDGDGNVSGT